MSVDAEELKRWVAARRAAEDRELAEVGENPPSVREAVAAALALVALCGRLIGWPVPEDAVRARENEQARQSWATLRARYSE